MYGLDHETRCDTRVYSSSDDRLLVSSAKLGQHEAFIELFNRHSHSVLRAVLRITKNYEDAEDVVQEALTSAFIHIGSFDGRSQFSTWLTRIAINGALTVLRKRRSRPESPLHTRDEEPSMSSWHFVETSIGPEMHCIRRERALHLHEAIKGLRPTLREIIEVHLSLECSVESVAHKVGLTVPATKSRLLRARNNLRISLARKRQL